MTCSEASNSVGRCRLALAMLVGGALVAAPASADVCAAKSGARRVALVELFTSEGSSSCPPADRWLTATFAPGAEGANAVPLAFHVDYWDRLGWKDRFATPAWTARQHAAARANRLRFVYTPQVLVEGKDLPDWRGSGSAAAVGRATAQPPRATLSLEARYLRGALAVKASAHVPANGDRKGAALYVALADSGLVSEVRAGENAGARLMHDHVVRALHSGIAVNGNGDAAGDLTLPLPSEAGAAATLVAFVQNPETGDVLQTLALPVWSADCKRAR